MPRIRKIPGKKHRGVKDPEVQRARREEILKPKLNSLPKNLDDQEVPKRLKYLMKLNDNAIQKKKELAEKKKNQNGEKETKKKNKDLLDSSKYVSTEMRLAGMTRPLKPVPVFQQMPGESQRKFFGRMETSVQQFLKQRNYESKHNVDLVRDPNTGKPKFVEAEKDELEEEEAEKKRAKLAKKGIVIKSKEEKRQLKRQKEKERKQKKKRKRNVNKEDDFKQLEEKPMPFNDVVHEPPTLKLPRGVTSTETRRPGNAKNLLLAKKLEVGGRVEKPKKGKSELSLASKERLRIERERVIKEYRLLKKNNFDFNSSL